MSGKIKDTDYLFLSAFIRAKETKMLTARDYDRMLEGRSVEDALKVLAEHGYGEMSFSGAAGLESCLMARRAAVMEELFQLAPDKKIVDIFRIRYDYHNAKVLIKAEGANMDGAPLLSDAGRIRAGEITDLFLQERYSALPAPLGRAMKEARQLLARSHNPQMADVILDKAYYEEFCSLARESGSAFLYGYARLSVDCANLKTAVRMKRSGSSPAEMEQCLLSGGTAGPERIMKAAEDGNLREVFSGTPAYGAAALGDAAAAEGGSITAFEKACDEMLAAYLGGARTDAFSEKVLISHICAVENELTSVRIILTGMMAGMAPDTIRERLRGLNV